MNDSFPPVIDGVANAVTNYASVIQRDYGDATVVTPYYPDADDSAYPFPVLRYPSIDMTKLVGYRAGFPLSAELMEQVEGRHIDLIHSHCPVTSTILARMLRQRLHVPLVFTYHTKFDIDIANAVRGKLLQEEAARILVENISACDEVWTVSNGAGENLCKLGYKGRYTVMPNGVDFPRGRVDDALIAKATRSVDLPAGVPVFLFVGRMMWYKGIRIILDALKALDAAGQDFRMVFIGAGGDEKEVRAEVETLRLSDRCFFTGSIADRETLRAWYSRADLFLFPSTFDTNGLVVREAAACALGSVLIAGSCAAEDVTDGVNGFLIEENAESMAAKLLELCAAPEAMARIGAGAQRDIYMSWEQAVDRAYARYFDVIDNYRRGLYPKHEKISDEMYKTMANYLDSAGRAREAQRRRAEELRRSYESLVDGITGDRERLISEMRMNRDLVKDDLDESRARLKERLDELTDRIDRFL